MQLSRFSLALALLATLVSGSTKSDSNRSSDFKRPLTRDQRIQHAVNRLTFGGRPGDFTQIQQEGLKQWIERQLRPERIPEDPQLATLLAPFESVRLSPRETYLRYPPPSLIAAVAKGKKDPGDDPELRANLERLAQQYRDRKADTPEPTFESVSFNNILEPDQVAILRKGSPEQKEAVLRDIPSQKRQDFIQALNPDMRRRFFAVAPVDLRRQLMLSVNPDAVVADDLTETKILRAIYSERQLQELLADFWFNHFNVFLDKGQDRYLVGSYERDAIRPHVLGKFYDLLLATAQSPAMLFYLDNAESSVPDATPHNGKQRGLNENYGRELMELHTLGVDGGYTQKDVTEVARCFTGWTITGPRKGSIFQFNEKMHDEDEKVVLGHRIHAGGMQDGIEVLKLLASSPVTAHHIALQLAQRFVADDPPPALVDRMAKVFVNKGGDLREVMRTMLRSPEFWSQGAFQAKVKTPLELIASAIRSSGANLDSAFALTGELQRLGEPLYRKIEPTGYTFANSEWISSASLLERVNFAANLAHNHIPGVKVAGTIDPESLASPEFQKH